MTGTLSIQDFEKELAFHKRMVGNYEKLVADTRAAQKEFGKPTNSSGSSGGQKAAVPTARKKSRGKKKNGVNMSEKIREVFQKTPDAGNKDVIATLKKEGIEVSDALVSGVKRNMGLTKKKKGRKTSTKANSSASASASASAPKQKNLKTLIKRILGRKKVLPEGLKLADLTAEILKAGYQTTSKKGNKGLGQIVYQTLRGMAKDGKFVIHDKAAQRWKLNKNAA